MKICHLITRLIVGGAQDNTMHTVLHLNKLGHDVVLAGGPHEENPGLLRWARTEGVKIKIFPLMKRKINLVDDFFSFVQLFKYFKRQRFDVVHTHSTQAGIYGRIAAKLARVPIVVHTIHGTPFSETRFWIINQLTLYFERIAAACSSKIISNATILSKEYLSRNIGNQKQYTTIYSGIDLEKFRKAKPIRKIREKSDFNIAHISRVTEGKGHKESFNAIKNLDSHLFFVGDGDKFDKYKKQFDAQNITFLGYRDDVDRIIASCDLVILPSYREGTPRSITEAMASGKPVVATNIAGIPEQIVNGVNGYLIPIKNSKALKEKIVKLMKNSKLMKEMGIQGIIKSKIFSVEKMVDSIEKLYFDLNMKRKNK